MLDGSAQTIRSLPPLEMMPHSIPSPTIAGLEFLTGFTFGQSQDVVNIGVFPLDQPAH